MPIIIGLGVIFVVCAIAGFFLGSDGILGFISRLFLWLYEKFWFLLIAFVVIFLLLNMI